MKTHYKRLWNTDGSRSSETKLKTRNDRDLEECVVEDKMLLNLRFAKMKGKNTKAASSSAKCQENKRGIKTWAKLWC